MRTAAIVLATAAAVALASPAHADPGCSDPATPECGGHAWNGPQLRTWDTPGYYGGWNNGPELCDPFTYQCRGVATP